MTPHTTTSVLIRWQVRPGRQGGARVPQGLRQALCWDQEGNTPQTHRTQTHVHTHLHAPHSTLRTIRWGRCSYSPLLQARTQTQRGDVNDRSWQLALQTGYTNLIVPMKFDSVPSLGLPYNLNFNIWNMFLLKGYSLFIINSN